MLYDQQTNRSLAFAFWQWWNELNAETAELDAARDTEEFLGFSGDSKSVPFVSLRVKALYWDYTLRPLSPGRCDEPH